MDDDPCKKHADTDALMPDGYIARAAWAEQMDKTHVQELCPGCRLWRVWAKRVAAAEVEG